MEIINLKLGTEKVIQKAAATLKAGGLIIYPTETCYGLGVDATSPLAVEKLLKYKGERRGKPISIAVADQKMAEKYVEINLMAANLYQNFLPGPLTVVSKSKGRVVSVLESANQTLGIRVPDYRLISKIIRRFGKPITATSANTSGKKPPYSLADLKKYTTAKRLNLVSLFLDAGKLPPRPPSTVVDTTLNEPTVLRQGEIIILDIPGQVFISSSEQETKEIARQILAKYRNILVSKALIFALQGELGSGKTRFTKGLAEALKITANVPSPTFIFVREYPYRQPPHQGLLYHIDTWRMEDRQELLALGLEKMLQPHNIIAIEWLQKVRPILEKIPQSKAIIIWVTIETLSETRRRIKYQT